MANQDRNIRTMWRSIQANFDQVTAHWRENSDDGLQTSDKETARSNTAQRKPHRKPGRPYTEEEKSLLQEAHLIQQSGAISRRELCQQLATSMGRSETAIAYQLDTLHGAKTSQDHPTPTALHKRTYNETAAIPSDQQCSCTEYGTVPHSRPQSSPQPQPQQVQASTNVVGQARATAGSPPDSPAFQWLLNSTPSASGSSSSLSTTAAPKFDSSDPATAAGHHAVSASTVRVPVNRPVHRRAGQPLSQQEEDTIRTAYYAAMEAGLTPEDCAEHLQVELRRSKTTIMKRIDRLHSTRTHCGTSSSNTPAVHPASPVHAVAPESAEGDEQGEREGEREGEEAAQPDVDTRATSALMQPPIQALTVDELLTWDFAH